MNRTRKIRKNEMKMETLPPTGNLIITSFDDQVEAELVFESLLQLRDEGRRRLGAFMITKYENGGHLSKYIGPDRANLYAAAAALRSLDRLLDDPGVVGTVIRLLSPGSSALM